MVNKDIDLKQYKESIYKKDIEDCEQNIRKEQTISQDVVLFFSYDVVNSSAYKTINYLGWAKVLNILFRKLKDEVSHTITGSEMWRILGDEAIFIVKIKSEDNLPVIIDRIFEILCKTIRELKGGTFFDDVTDRERESQLMKLQNILSLKATAWIALVSNTPNVDDYDTNSYVIENIFEKYRNNNDYEIFEFLGNDIDTGFRISKQTRDARLAISFELAYLIAQKTESLSFLHIITYKRLKGVWKEKLYPIIWYHNPKRMHEIDFENSFSFDESVENDLIQEYYNERDSQNKNRLLQDTKMLTDVYLAFNKILNDRNLKPKLDKIKEVIKNNSDIANLYIKTELLQVHCVAVCYQIQEDIIKILLAKRCSARENFSGLWEFGCAKASFDKTITEKIIEEYREDFNIEVMPVIDSNRQIKEPIPLALYQVEKNEGTTNRIRKHKGIIMLAEIQGDFEPSDFNKTSKHDELRWITEDELEKVVEKDENFVPDFKETLKLAFKKIKQLKSKET